MDVTWLCEDGMVARQEGNGRPDMVDAALSIGMPALRVAVAAVGSLSVDGPVVVWGTGAFVAACREAFEPDALVGLFASEDARRYGSYASRLADVMLNKDYVTMTFGEVLRDPRIATEGLFAKPSIHAKRFTGTVLTATNLPGKLADLAHVDPATPCIVAPVRHDVIGEARYVIAGGSRVAGSTYRWAGKLDVRRDTLPVTDALADEVAGRDWRPEDVFVCDVAATVDGGARVVELNPFSTSGLYMVDTVAVARSVTDVVREMARSRARGMAP